MSIRELQSAVEDALSAYHAAPSYEASEAVQSARAALASGFADGAVECPGCGVKPVGMCHPAAVKNKIVDMFEIGCLSCEGRRVMAPMSRELAVKSWNEECAK